MFHIIINSDMSVFNHLLRGFDVNSLILANAMLCLLKAKWRKTHDCSDVWFH